MEKTVFLYSLCILSFQINQKYFGVFHAFMLDLITENINVFDKRFYNA